METTAGEAGLLNCVQGAELQCGQYLKSLDGGAFINHDKQNSKERISGFICILNVSMPALSFQVTEFAVSSSNKKSAFVRVFVKLKTHFFKNGCKF